MSELYVVLRTAGAAAGLELIEFRREGEARISFVDAEGHERAIAPDVRVALRAEDGRMLIGHVELDLGTMSHARLRMKLAGYFAHAQVAAPAADTSPLPTLLFITTSAQRTETFLRAVARLRASGRWEKGGAELQVLACARARDLDAVLSSPCWHGAPAPPSALDVHPSAARALRDWLPTA